MISEGDATEVVNLYSLIVLNVTCITCHIFLYLKPSRFWNPGSYILNIIRSQIVNLRAIRSDE